MVKLLTISRAMRSGIALGAIMALILAPVTPASAGSGKATWSTSTQPTSLTLSDATTIRHGLIKVSFTPLTTATHTTLTIVFSQNPAATVGISVTDVQPTSAGCTPALGQPTFTFTCDLGTLAANTTIVRLIEFQSPDVTTCTTSPCTLTTDVKITFAEGGNDVQGGPQGTKNDTLRQVSVITLWSPADIARADGGCRNDFPATYGTLASAAANRASQATVFAAASPAPSSFGPVSFPCTAASTGVKQVQLPANTPLHSNQIWFADVQTNPRLSSAVLTAYQLSGVSPGNFVLYELLNGDPKNPFPVPDCLSDGTVPPSSPTTSCVVAQQPYGKGGIQVTVNFENLVDPGWAG